MTAIERTTLWINQMVVGLGLCPFASRVVINEEIKFVLSSESDSGTLSTLMMSLASNILDDAQQESTAIIILDKGLESFLDYLDVIADLEDHLKAEGFDDQIQLASFHPEYQFAGTEIDDVSNYTNRSPYPLIHLLKSDDVEVAIAGHPDIHSVPTNNIKKMNSLGLDGILEIYKRFVITKHK